MHKLLAFVITVITFVQIATKFSGSKTRIDQDQNITHQKLYWLAQISIVAGVTISVQYSILKP